MFTGLVADLGEVTRVEHTPEGLCLQIATGLAGQLHEGDSINVSGVCLTATSLSDGHFDADVMNETLRLTSLAEVRPGMPVNLELAMSAQGRFGGHIVQGHVDGVGRVSETAPDGFSRRVTIEAPAELLRYLVYKGSVAVDGVSLTLAALHERSFGVSLIPETLERTSLGAVQVGSPVNLEVDVLAKYVERLISR